ncbi:hypothetical protein [Vitreoscilla stercoraria]|uniref:Uncharacterized protein n=1 Tax=Vitreoscilla stercoraria TaxID=61 RepID=A0ABY4EDP4_VITST|nr:hypothetical protein [Vitreoscilla stercoraria]UOO93572.1 hypothetical protein LVJ81_05985 [Vitreoscilla stercoraria]
MDIKKLLENPMVVSTTISGIGAVIVEATLESHPVAKKIISALLGPISILISFAIAWAVSKCATFTLEELQALSIFEQREKTILETLEKNPKLLTSKTKKELRNELNEIAIAKAKIGKKNTTVESFKKTS